MNWEAIGAIGEIVGAISVLVTLIFLILQIQQNTIALQQQSSRASTSSLQQISATMMNPDVAAAISPAYAEAEAELTIPQTVQLEHQMMSYLLVLQQDFLDWRKGIHPNVIWESRIPLIDAIFIAQRAREWWENIGHKYFTPEFKNLVDECLTKEARLFLSLTAFFYMPETSYLTLRHWGNLSRHKSSSNIQGTIQGFDRC